MQLANNTSVKVRKAETYLFKHLMLKRVRNRSQKLLLSGQILKPPRMDTWVTLNMEVFKIRKKTQCQNIYRKTIKKLHFHIIHLSSMKKYPNRLKFKKRKYKSRKASKVFKTCCVKTIFFKMTWHQINFLSTSTICSASQINRHLKAITLTVSLIGTSSICVIYLSYQFSWVKWCWTWK